VLGLLLGLSPRIAPLLTSQNLIVLWMLLLPLATLVFTLPLIGVHQLLVREKACVQNEVEGRVEAVVRRVHSVQDADDLGNIGSLKTLLDSLLVERDLVARFPT
jgi:hypothetical protein